MKAKVIIENGETTVSLTPENDFEKDMIEKLYLNKTQFDSELTFKCNVAQSWGIFKDHQIILSIKDNQNKP